MLEKSDISRGGDFALCPIMLIGGLSRLSLVNMGGLTEPQPESPTAHVEHQFWQGRGWRTQKNRGRAVGSFKAKKAKTHLVTLPIVLRDEYLIVRWAQHCRVYLCIYAN